MYSNTTTGSEKSHKRDKHAVRVWEGDVCSEADALRQTDTGEKVRREQHRYSLFDGAGI